jgi:translation initiation factor 2D
MPTVFKKDLQIMADQKLSGKDAKKIIASVQALYGEEASSLLGKKDVSLRRTGGGTVAMLYCSEAGPLFFEAEADAGGARDTSLLPTLLALWRAPILPTLLVPAPVSAFLTNNADLMLPGVLGYENWRDGLNAGDVACVAVHGNPAPLALGRLLVNGSVVTSSLSRAEAVQGRCLEVLHVFGDGLWKYAGRPLPNAGFEVSEGRKTVRPLAGAATAGGGGRGGGGGGRGGGGAADSEEDGEDGEDGECAGNVEDAEGEAGEAESEAEAEAEEEGEEAAAAAAAVEAGRKAMDELMRQCFLQAAHRLSDKQLPLPLNTFYSQHMRPCRPAGSSLEVKASSWKKLQPFMQALSLEGLCELRASKGASKGAEPALASICRRHADYTAHLPWDDSCGEAGATKAAAAAAGPPPVTVALLYRPSHKQEPLFKAAGLDDAKAFYDAQQATAVLDSYVAANGLLLGEKGGGAKNAVLSLDGPLCDALFAPRKGQPPPPGPLPTQMRLSDARTRFTAALEPFTRLSGGTLEKPKLTTGRAPPAVTISTSQRRGHMVTLLEGLEPLGLQPQVVARELQALAGASAGVEEVVGEKSGVVVRTVMVQGLWDSTASELLTKKYGLPAACVDNRAAAGKKGMRQKQDKAPTNIRRA